MTDKGRILAFPDTAAIEAEAAAWVARFDAGDVSAKDQAAFQEWLNRSALHRETIAEYGNLWSEFDALKPLAGGEAGRQADAQERQPDMVKRASPWLAACAAVKQAVADIPVFAVGRIVDATYADSVIAAGKADVVTMARALIADPELPNKAREGRLADIRPWLGDNQECIGRVMQGMPMGCTVNPSAGREAELGIGTLRRVSVGWSR